MNNLLLYGWNDELFQQKQLSQFNNLFHGRVAVVHRTCYDVIGENGVYQSELTGSMLYSKSPDEYPCTGDWVIFQPLDDDKAIIVDILPRIKTLYRKKSGSVSDRQAIASHVDKAFIVQSLDANFNVRRIERFVVQVMEEGISPVIVLTKSDLGFDNGLIITSLKHLANKAPVFITSIHNLEQIKELRNYIELGETVVFIGSSGVGKSSLINALCEKDILLTSHISDSTGKGRHTSTRREMVLMENSGVLIDTPGVREFGIVLDGTDSLSLVMDISQLEAMCRFADCSHVNEPGCAVIEAVESGRLDKDVYESYLKLRRETWHFTASEHEKRKKERSFTKRIKDVKTFKHDKNEGAS